MDTLFQVSATTVVTQKSVDTGSLSRLPATQNCYTGRGWGFNMQTPLSAAAWPSATAPLQEERPLPLAPFRHCDFPVSVFHGQKKISCLEYE